MTRNTIWGVFKNAIRISKIIIFIKLIQFQCYPLASYKNMIWFVNIQNISKHCWIFKHWWAVCASLAMMSDRVYCSTYSVLARCGTWWSSRDVVAAPFAIFAREKKRNKISSRDWAIASAKRLRTWNFSICLPQSQMRPLLAAAAVAAAVDDDDHEACGASCKWGTHVDTIWWLWPLPHVVCLCDVVNSLAHECVLLLLLLLLLMGDKNLLEIF